jgi:hypothetical protein
MKDYRLITIIVALTLLRMNVYAQKNHSFVCGDIIHGIAYLHIHNCDQDMLITSLPEDGSEGSIVKGFLETSGKIVIAAGYSLVRIMPDDTQSKGSQPHSTTKVGGNNGNAGRKSSPKIKKQLSEEIKVFPNTVDESSTIYSELNKVVSYQLLDNYGKLIKREKFTPVNKVIISFTELKKGMYLLNIQLENGTQLIKKIIKN